MSDQRVLVTGANGFLGSHVVKQLLLAGYRVRGTLRNIEDRGDVVAALKKLVPNAEHELELVDVDLLNDDGWESAMSGCSSVIHTACPLPSVLQELSEEFFLEHAVDGSLRVLRAAERSGVTKVVMTSANTATFGPPMIPVEGTIYTENDWTDLKFPNLDIYTKCKTMAEKAAWNFIASLPEGRKLSLTTLLPAGLVGPPLLKPLRIGGSVEVMDKIMNHVYPGCPNLMTAYCDVQQAAECHFKALTTPAAEGQRILLVTAIAWMLDVAKMVANEFRPQGYTIHTNTLPSFVMWLPQLFDKRFAKSGMFNRIGKKICFSNKKMKDTFGIVPTPLNESIIDMIYAMVDLGITFKAEKYKQVGSRAVLATDSSTQKEE